MPRISNNAAYYLDKAIRLDENAGDRLSTETMTHVDYATHNGDKYHQVQEFLVDAANPLYVLYELPAGADRDVELIKRFFQANNDSADLLILWDYDVGNATKTPLPKFNSNNKFNGGGNFEISLLNPVTAQDPVTGVITVGAYTPTDQGAIREACSIQASGLGSNKSGGISPDVGTRVYTPGTGYLFKVTSAGNANKITAGYIWDEDQD